MFSYFEKGITDTIPSRTVDLPQLIKLIRNNPNQSLIESIRSLRLNNDNYYKKLKDTLPNITPNCILHKRSLSKDSINKNLIVMSNYIYFDIDIPGHEYKDYIIKRYGHLVSMVCVSSSAGGISLLFKITNEITKDNFLGIRTYIRTKILGDEPVDEKCKDIGRCMFISYDKDVYANYENEITINLDDIISNDGDDDNDSNNKRESQTISYKKRNNRVKYSFSSNDDSIINKQESIYSILPIDIVLTKLMQRTIVKVDNLIVDFKPVEYAEVYIPQVIKDGTKHTIYTSMIHQLIYLNPDIEKEYIFSFLFYVNNVFAKPKMDKKELVRLFNFIYNCVKSSGDVCPRLTIKMVHFNPKCKLTGKQKNIVANQLNGSYKKYCTVKRIIQTKCDLDEQGIKITQKNVSERSGLSLKTVQKYFNSSIVDMDKMIYDINICSEYLTKSSEILL